MIFKNPHLMTKLDIWFPRYHDQYENGGERVVLLARYKVEQASPWIIVSFSRAKHLMNQRFCIRRSQVEQCQLDTNGKIPCYVVPMSKLERWDTVDEVKEVITGFGW